MAKLCIIPARGGSKRISRKNIKYFLGKPIIAYSIKAALNSGLFDEVMVSTDDREIAEIAKKYGAKVPFLRTEQASNDFATTYDVIEEVVLKYQTLGLSFEHTCCLYSCAPFVTSIKLSESLETMLNGKFDSVFPVMAFSFPIQRALKLGNYKKIEFYYPEYSLTRSQDLEKAYHDSGQFYWLHTQACIDKGKIITENSGSIIISEIEGQDIDNEIDWKLAEIKYKLNQNYHVI
jgi:pseudaminic acid cytidylyltransferase